MEPLIVNQKPEYEPPLFRPAPQAGYLYLAAAVAPPAGPPFVRHDARRAALLARLKQRGHQLTELPEVEAVSVFRAILVPPAGRGARHPARYDVAVLIETDSPASLDAVRAAPAYQQMLATLQARARDVNVMAASCLRYIGPVDHSKQGLFLFNHFEAPDADTGVVTGLWEHLAGWYVAETGLDNSELLAPIGDHADYVFVNHARWDKSLPRLAVEQFARKSFRSYVRANLRANQVIAMPVLCRLA
ncbi:MAG: hypothetical protein ACRDNZ_03825 [Streptosporangiaceae bacterium]